ADCAKRPSATASRCRRPCSRACRRWPARRAEPGAPDGGVAVPRRQAPTRRRYRVAVELNCRAPGKGDDATAARLALRLPGASRMIRLPATLRTVRRHARLAGRARLRVLGLLGAFVVALAPGIVAAQTPCATTGDLDPRYCDADGDLIADTPADKAQQKDPATLIFSFTPVEDPAVYEGAFSDFLAHLAKVTGRRVRWYAAESYAAQVEALRSGRLHIAGVASGATPYAVNLGGFVPLVTMQKTDGSTGYTLQLVVRADSPIRSPADLKGRKVAHVSPSSNSGDTAPRVLFASQGVVADKDYTVVYSGKHDNSILGVLHGDYDAAPV